MKLRTILALVLLLLAVAGVAAVAIYRNVDSEPRAGSASPNEGHGVLGPR